MCQVLARFRVQSVSIHDNSWNFVWL